MIVSVDGIEVGIVVQMVIQTKYIGYKCVANVECHVYENWYHYHLQRQTYATDVVEIAYHLYNKGCKKSEFYIIFIEMYFNYLKQVLTQDYTRRLRGKYL